MSGPGKLVEYWRWRYRDPDTGRICLLQLSEKGAAPLPEAQRIEGSMLLRDVDADNFPDTGPEVHRISPES